MHRVAVVAFDGVVPFDLSTPLEVLGRARHPSGRPAYEVRVCGHARDVDAGAFRMRLRHGLGALRTADTVIVPGIADLDLPTPPELLRAIRRAAQAGARIASICTGALVLAATGLLDGKRATTHWLAAPELARRFPRVSVDPDVLFVDQGQLLTSAGATAGIDLCLHLVRRDHGAAAAAAVARLSVMPLQRDGGQAQFIEHAPPPDADLSLARVLEWLEKHLGDDTVTLHTIARRAAMSVRTLSRQFRAQVGTTPHEWLVRARVDRAKVLLETTSLPIERIAPSVGFGSVAAFRAQFRRIAGTSPLAYRRAFQTAPAGGRQRQKSGSPSSGRSMPTSL